MQPSWIATGAFLAALWGVGVEDAAPGPHASEPPVEPSRDGSGQDDEPNGKALYLENCARCHGETGDGKGITELDRPARSFRDGGFSYGNTPAAIRRTIANGIPGTPMPAFDSSTTAQQRADLAAYVISLGPPGITVDPDATELVVRDRALVVRGFLPPIAEGAPSHPRGLLIGTTDGLTFEYRVDDVRLLGVRAGRFVQRRDWAGRGGDPLKPLGNVVHLFEGGDPGPPFFSSTNALDEAGDTFGKRLRAKLRGSRVEDGSASLHYALQLGDETVLQLSESLEAASTPTASGFRRTFRPLDLEATGQRGGTLGLTLARLAPEDAVESRSGEVLSADGETLVVRRADGLAVTYHLGLNVSSHEPSEMATFELTALGDGSKRLDVLWLVGSPEPLHVTILSATEEGR